MIQFKVFAPSSLSLFGAVTRGKIGVKAAIDLRTTLIFEELSTDDSDSFKINCPKLFVHPMIGSLSLFKMFYDRCVEHIENKEYFREKVLKEFRCTCNDYPENKKNILITIFYLLVYIIHKEQIEIKSFAMDLSTELMMEDEFACPASFAVCLAAGLLHWSRLQQGVTDNYDSTDNEKIQLYAARCQEFFPKTETINVKVCTHGSIIKYKAEEVIHSTTLFEIPSMAILLVEQTTRNQEDQTKNVAMFINANPEPGNRILDTINAQSEMAYDAFQQLVNVYKDNELSTETRDNNISELYNVIKGCIRDNQTALDELGVIQSPDIIRTITQNGMYGKYTDIAKGRYIYILCPLHTDESSEAHITLLNELRTNGFNVKETHLSRSVVKIERIE